MNDFTGHGRFNAMYYWEQFHPILSAVAILLVGWIIALLVAAGVKKSCKNWEPIKSFRVQRVTAPILKISSPEWCSGLFWSSPS